MDDEFLDDDEGIVRTFEEGKSYLHKNWSSTSTDEIRTNKELRTEVIANLLGVNRGIVERVRPR